MTTENNTPQTISMQEVMHINKEKGYHFFSEGSTRFFNSRYPVTAQRVGDYDVFTTSEQYSSDTERKYSVRVQNNQTGKNFTMGEFNAYTQEEAKKLKKAVVTFYTLLNISTLELREWEEVEKIKGEKYATNFIFAKYARNYRAAELNVLKAWAST